MDPQTLANGIHEFELVDARGNTHTYMVTETPAGEGVEIMFAIMALGAPTALGLAGAAVASERMFGMVVDALRQDLEKCAVGDLCGRRPGPRSRRRGAGSFPCPSPYLRFAFLSAA